MKKIKRHSNTFLTKLVSFLLTGSFFFSSVLPGWAHPADSLRPRVTAQGYLRQELEQIERLSLRASDGARTRDGGQETIQDLMLWHIDDELTAWRQSKKFHPMQPHGFCGRRKKSRETAFTLSFEPQLIASMTIHPFWKK